MLQLMPEVSGAAHLLGRFSLERSWSILGNPKNRIYSSKQVFSLSVGTNKPLGDISRTFHLLRSHQKPSYED